MALEELLARLNDGGYKNWLKAGRCLVILKEALHPLTDQHMRAFHGHLLCSGCSEWKTEILKHHRQPNININWDNCNPAYWRTDHWEVAKAFMPRGQVSKQRADQCDASALLNLINNCNCFCFVDPKVVREVIRCRNELMHSSEFRVRDEWMRCFQTSLKHFVRQIGQNSPMENLARQIDEMLKLDLSISVESMDLMDGLEADTISQCKASSDLVSQWEAELLQELLQEFLETPAEDEDTNAPDSEQLRILSGFLEANTDLSKRFSAELQVINSLKAKERGE